MNNYNYNTFNTYQNFNNFPSLFPLKIINIIFQTDEGKRDIINFPVNLTVHLAFKQYLQKIGKYNGLSIEQKNKINFIYNSRTYKYLDERTIGNAFNDNNFIIRVSFPENGIKINKCERCNLKLNTIGISNNSTFIQQNFNNDNYQLNEKIHKYKKQLNEEKNKIKHLEIENNNLKQELRALKSSKKNYLLTESNKDILTVKFETLVNNDISNYSLKCNNTDLFAKLEERLYKDFPYLKKENPCFFIKDRNIERFKNMEENKIKNNDIISIYIFGK